MQRTEGARSAVAGVGDVLALFRQQPSLTRADVGRETGLSRATVNQRLDALLAAQLLLPAGEESPTRGRPAGHFAFNGDRGVLLVADIGATGMGVAVCDLSGAILLERHREVDVADGPAIVLSVTNRMFEDMLAQLGKQPALVHGIGLDVPGPVDFALGQVVSPPIMTGWDRFDIPGWFARRYACPVLVDKDVNAMAWGENRTVHPEVSNMLMLKVGTGVGSGIIANGQVYRGADGAAGDIGHNQIPISDDAQEPLCRCGNTGCVEAYVGGWALLRDLRAEGRDIGTVSQAVELVRGGDPAALRLSRRAGRILGAALSDAVSLLNPAVLVVGGQLARAEEQLFAGIREMIYRRSLPLATRHLRIVPSQLDQRAGLIGLTYLLSDRIFEPALVEKMLLSTPI